jgi:molecular chaperone DnaK
VHVTAKDMATNKEQTITITSSTGLSDEDIDRMVKDAEKYAEEDEKRLKEIETRNNADSMIYQAEKLIKENEEQMDDESRRRSAKPKMSCSLL